MKDITFKSGFGSNYDEMTLWLAAIQEGAVATKIEKIDGEYEITNGAVVAATAKSDYDTEDEYFKVCDELCGDGDVTGEFITNNDCYYVVIKLDGIKIKAENVIYDEVDFS